MLTFFSFFFFFHLLAFQFKLTAPELLSIKKGLKTFFFLKKKNGEGILYFMVWERELEGKLITESQNL